MIRIYDYLPPNDHQKGITLEKLLNNLLEHEQLRARTINMIASENRTSQLVRCMLCSDLAHRYTDELYGGTQYIRRIVEICEEIMKDLFQAKYVLVTPLSGNFAVLAAVLGLTKPNGLIAKTFSEDGGFPLNLQAFNRLGLKLPFDHEYRTIDLDRSRDAFDITPPTLLMLGQSVLTHPLPVQPFKKLLKEVHLQIPIVYDGSHVLGLIAGHSFQDPLSEGADILLGSTHKTFFGPQGGIVLSNDRRLFKKVARIGGFTQGSHTLVDNIHNHRVAALAIAGLEHLEFGKDYASQIIKNSKALAAQLYNKGLPVKGAKVNFTESHQVLLDYPQKTAFQIKKKLESIGIITDVLLRLGTSELTRLGMKEPEMKEIANLIADCILENLQTEKLINRVVELSSRYQSIHYTFNLANYPTIRHLLQNYFSL